MTPFRPGDTITIQLEETVFHPGHYRVALALNSPSELPPEPTVTAGASQCGSVAIQQNPVFPVLADSMLQHTQTLSGQQSFQVKLPTNVTCTNCTLQIIEFMSSHAAPCFYHHCANIAIQGGTSDGGTGTSDAGRDSAGGAGGAGGAGATGGGAGAGGAGASGGAGGAAGSAGGAGGSSATGGSAGSGGGTAGAGGAATGGAAGQGGATGSPIETSGCTCSVLRANARSSTGANILLALVFVAHRRRRR
jgi:hypothetical protein